MPSEYAYQSGRALAARKPYSFAPVGDADFLAAYRHARHRLLDALLPAAQQAHEGHPIAVLLERLAVEPLNTWLEAPKGRGDGTRGLPPPPGRSAAEGWEAARAYCEASLAHGGRVRSDLLLQELLRPCLARAARLQGLDASTRWATETIDRLAHRFAVHGRIFACYDARWRRACDDAAFPPAYAWLALGVAWRAASAWRLEPAVALRSINTLLALADRIAAEVLEGRWQLRPLDALAAQVAVAMELDLVANCEPGLAGHGLEAAS